MSNSIPTSELNMRCAGVKRLLKEACELRVPNELFFAKPMEDNLFEWHFTMRGAPDTVYEKGVYHGRIILPAEYPMKPPSLIMLTPNGRFETNKKICLSISGYHPETWLPSWSIRTALLALVGFMPTHSAGAVGGLECSEEERKRLAIKSLDWRCETCDCVMRDILPTMTSAESPNLLKEVEVVFRGNRPADSSNAATTSLSNAENTHKLIDTQTMAPSIPQSTSSSGVEEQSPLHTLWIFACSPIRLLLSILLSSPSTPSGGAMNNEQNSTNASRQPIAPSGSSGPSKSVLVWIMLLSMLFLALLFRRLLSTAT